jgi:hypothetical protein
MALNVYSCVEWVKNYPPLSSYILADLAVVFSSVRGNGLMVGRAVSELQRTAG